MAWQARAVLLDASTPDVLVRVELSGAAPGIDGGLEVTGPSSRRLVAHPVGDPETEPGVLVRGIELQGASIGIDRLLGSLRAAPDGQGVADRPPGAGVGVRLGLAAQRGRVRGTGRPRSTRRRVVGERLVEELGRERLGARPDGADDAVLVDRDDDRDGRRLQKIDRVVEDRPVEPLPLGKQPAAVGVLLLGDAQQYQAPLLHPLASRFVPDWHVLAAAHSPGGELDQQHLLAAEVRQRRWVCDRRSSAE